MADHRKRALTAEVPEIETEYVTKRIYDVNKSNRVNEENSHVKCPDGSFSVSTYASKTIKSMQRVLDSGASSHMTNDLKNFSSLNKEINQRVTIANGTELIAEGVGQGCFTTNTLRGN